MPTLVSLELAQPPKRGHYSADALVNGLDAGLPAPGVGLGVVCRPSPTSWRTASGGVLGIIAARVAHLLRRSRCSSCIASSWRLARCRPNRNARQVARVTIGVTRASHGESGLTHIGHEPGQIRTRLRASRRMCELAVRIRFPPAARRVRTSLSRSVSRPSPAFRPRLHHTGT